MRRRLALGAAAAAVALMFAGAAGTPAAQVAPAPMATAAPLNLPSAVPVAPRGVDPAIMARAKNWLHRLAVDDIDRGQLDDQANARLTDSVAKRVSGQLRPLGDPIAFRFVGERAIPGNVSYIFLATFKTETLDWVFTLNESNRISGLRVVPVQ